MAKIVGRRKYYYIAAKDETGKPYLISAAMCRTEDEARQHGMETLAGLDFKIVQYPTRDLNAAMRMYRGYRLDHGYGLRTAARRQGHEKSINRLKRKRRLIL